MADEDLVDYDASNSGSVSIVNGGVGAGSTVVPTGTPEDGWTGVAMHPRVSAGSISSGTRDINGLNVLDVQGTSFPNCDAFPNVPYAVDPALFSVQELDVTLTDGERVFLSSFGNSGLDRYANVAVVGVGSDMFWCVELYDAAYLPDTRRVADIEVTPGAHVVGMTLDAGVTRLWVDGVEATLVDPEQAWPTDPLTVDVTFWFFTETDDLLPNGAYGEFRAVDHPSDSKVESVLAELMTKWGIESQVPEVLVPIRRRHRHDTDARDLVATRPRGARGRHEAWWD